VGAGGGIELDVDAQEAARGQHRGELGGVQQAVRTGVGVEGVVRGDTVFVQIDAEKGVGIDGVAQDRVAVAGGGGAGYPATAGRVPGVVEGDDVARAGHRSPNRIVRGRVVETDPGGGIGDGGGPRGVGPDLVPLNDRARGPGVVYLDAVVAIAGDHVAGPGCRASDHGVRRVEEHCDALAGVTHVRGAGRVRADVIALDQRVRGP